ncbi:hypothetical protein A3F66_04150 [candidate division TM6 bacterium RIFCSPHIGHO2_12_FULL_32_22]|nr:MAG: hypothetical protein A3F66_04150 [candidate division TM6 bacterium RIFCSPHIGHO2_12_FULL_32_22]
MKKILPLFFSISFASDPLKMAPVSSPVWAAVLDSALADESYSQFELIKINALYLAYALKEYRSLSYQELHNWTMFSRMLERESEGDWNKSFSESTKKLLILRNTFVYRGREPIPVYLTEEHINTKRNILELSFKINKISRLTKKELIECMNLCRMLHAYVDVKRWKTILRSYRLQFSSELEKRILYEPLLDR